MHHRFQAALSTDRASRNSNRPDHQRERPLSPRFLPEPQSWSALEKRKQKSQKPIRGPPTTNGTFASSCSSLLLIFVPKRCAIPFQLPDNRPSARLLRSCTSPAWSYRTNAFPACDRYRNLYSPKPFPCCWLEVLAYVWPVSKRVWMQLRQRCPPRVRQCWLQHHLLPRPFSISSWA